MTYRPLAVGNGTTFDTVGDPRIGAAAGGIPEASVAGLTASLAAKLAGVKADTAPSTPATNDVWLDTSGTAGVWKIWNGSAWVSFSGGSPAVVSSTTGSPTITSDASYTYYKFTGNGSITISEAGLADVLCVGGGASGYSGVGPGNGGDVREGKFLLPAATHTVTVGAGGVAGADTFGKASSLGTVVVTSVVGVAGGVGNGVGAGGTGATSAAAYASSISGASVNYAASNQSSGANTGNGGTTAGGSGLAGVVIVRIAK